MTVSATHGSDGKSTCCWNSHVLAGPEGRIGEAGGNVSLVRNHSIFRHSIFRVVHSFGDVDYLALVRAARGDAVHVGKIVSAGRASE